MQIFVELLPIPLNKNNLPKVTIVVYFLHVHENHNLHSTDPKAITGSGDAAVDRDAASPPRRA